MYTISKIAKQFLLKEPELYQYITESGIPVDKNGRISQKYEQMSLSLATEIAGPVKIKQGTGVESFLSSDMRVKVFKDDALSFLAKLPNNSIDVIATDPAYSGMNNKLMLGKGRIVGSYASRGNADSKWFTEFVDSEENYKQFLTECVRVLKKDTGHIYIMFDSYSLLSLGPLLREYLAVKNIITWDKVDLGMGHYFRRRHEYIVFSTSGNNRKLNSQKFPDVWRIKRIHNAKYPTQKPTEIFQTMLDASAKPNMVVCDPFLGSGSCAIAAIRSGCMFVGTDISQKAFDLSKLRIQKFIESGIDNLQSSMGANNGDA